LSKCVAGRRLDKNEKQSFRVEDLKSNAADRAKRFGFKFGRSGAHAARTMMLEEVRVLFARVPNSAPRQDYSSAIVTGNVLNKPTQKARELTLRHLVDLYGLDPAIAIFRAMRRLWDVDSAGQPLLLLGLALARDPLLRLTWHFVTTKKPGDAVVREEVEELLDREFPHRFSAASLKSFSQNINGTWTQAGFLSGKAKKIRSTPEATPANFTYLALLAHLEGFHGQRLLQSRWVRLLDRAPDRLLELATAASRRGLLVFMHSGGVIEARFPGYLTNEEGALLHE
jgi:hypothetical protein